MSTEAVVASLLPCTLCGYDLRMQPQAGRCPECGQQVAQSMGETLLQRGPAYLLGIARGARMAGILNVAAMGVTLCFMGFMFTLFWLDYRSDPTCFMVPLFFSYTVIAILHVVAARIIAAPLPRAPEGIVRPGILTCSLAFAVATLVPVAISIAASLDHQPGEWFFKSLLLIWTLLLPSLPLFVIGMGVQFAMLCKRAGMHSLVGWHHWISRIIAAGLMGVVVTFCFMTLIIFIEPRGGPPMRWFLLLLMGLFWGGLLVAGIGFVAATVLLFRTATRLRKLATETSAAPVAPGILSNLETQRLLWKNRAPNDQ
ncbi:MAG TPA: hypothetical protein VHM90_18415 [Phycisphaerae bacterium]|nr:hypothetical protein [Phycisphaerae bacterium]